MINIAICDDNQNVLSKLTEMANTILEKNALSGKIVLSTTKENEILDFVDSNKINVLLLDINLKNDWT